MGVASILRHGLICVSLQIPSEQLSFGLVFLDLSMNKREMQSLISSMRKGLVLYPNICDLALVAGILANPTSSLGLMQKVSQICFSLEHQLIDVKVRFALRRTQNLALKSDSMNDFICYFICVTIFT